MKYRFEGKVVRTSDRPYSHAIGCRGEDGSFRLISCCRTYDLAVKAASSSDARRAPKTALNRRRNRHRVKPPWRTSPTSARC